MTATEALVPRSATPRAGDQAAAVVIASLRSMRRAVIWWSVSNAGFVALTIAFWPVFKGASGISAAIGQLPPAVIEAFGLQDFGSPAGFLRGNLYDLLVPLLFSIAAVILVNGQTASDEAAGRLELYLTQPVSRRLLFSARAVAAGLALTVIVVATLVVQLVSDAVFGLTISFDVIVGTIVACGLLAAVCGAVTYAVAAWRGRPALALGAGVGLTLGGYIVAALFPLSSALKPWAAISPWNWAFAGNPLDNGFDSWRAALLVVVTVGLIVVGTILVSRRDVSAS
jgi:beta-exotoxin I transport system permease protein